MKRGASTRRLLGRSILTGILLLPLSTLAEETLEGSSWIVLPEAELRGLEEAVASQLISARQITLSVIADDSATPEELAATVGELGRHYHAYNLSAPAEGCYRIAGRLAPEDFRWPYYLGYLLQTDGRLDEAKQAYTRALGIHRAAPPALLRLGQIHLELGEEEAAGEVFREALNLDPSSAAVEAALGELYQSQGRHREAVELLRSALEKEPRANRLYYPLALAHRALGEMDEARRLLDLQGSVGIRPADPLIDGLERLTTGERIHLLRGQTAFRAGRFDEAAEEFRLAVAAQPESIAARIDLGSALGELGDVEGAIEQLERAVELAPGNETALFNIGVLLAGRGDLEQAGDYLKQAAELDPEDAGIRFQLAEALRQQDHFEEALGHYRWAIELDPHGEEARLGEAQALTRLGRYAEVRERLEEGLAVLPTSGLLSHALSRLLALGPDLELREGARALDLALKVYTARPSPAHAEVVAAALAELDRCKEAADWQRRLVVGQREAGLEDGGMNAPRVLSHYEKGPPCRYSVD
jgi:tetratricopeptide (TPR) repeat protein